MNQYCKKNFIKQHLDDPIRHLKDLLELRFDGHASRWLQPLEQHHNIFYVN